jgi:hypothetical protein
MQARRVDNAQMRPCAGLPGVYRSYTILLHCGEIGTDANHAAGRV